MTATARAWLVAAMISAAACGGSATVEGQGGGGGSGGSGGTAGHGSGGTGGASSSGGGGCADVCALHGPACCVPAIPCPAPGDECVIDILEASIDIIYSYEELEQQVASLPPDVALSIVDTDVESALAEPSPAARIELVLTPVAAAALNNELPNLLSHPFIVHCGGERLFVGVVYEQGGAAALEFPVLNVDVFTPPSHLPLRLGAWQGAWLGLGWDWNIERRIDHPEIRGRLCHRGVLSEMGSGP